MACLCAWCLIIPFSCFPKHLPGKNNIFKTRKFQSNSRLSVAFYMIGKNPRKFICFFRISVFCLCKLLNSCLYFGKYQGAILIFMVSFNFQFIISKTIHIHLFTIYLLNLLLICYLESCCIYLYKIISFKLFVCIQLVTKFKSPSALNH